MFSKLEVHASEVVWMFEPITFYMGELRGKLILAWHAMWMTNELLLEIHNFLSKCRWRPSPSKLEEPHEVILEHFPFLWSKRYVHWLFFKSISQVVHTRHLVLIDNNPTQTGHHMWKMFPPNFASYIWATHGGTSENNQCQPNKESYVLGVSGFYTYFWPTW